MVIHQFNKLIRNKWLWGAFAVIVGGAFAFDFLVDDLLRDGRGGGEERSSGRAGKLAGEPVAESTFLDIAEEVRGFGRQRDWRMKAGDVNRIAWENYAAIKVAERDGLVATDAEVQAAIRGDRSFQANGGFSFALYQRLLRENSLTPERFEAFLKRRITLMRIGQAVLASATWASPMELDQALADMTDVFTVRVARFTQSKKDFDAVKLDDAGLRKWYDDNVKSLELPERIKIRYVRFDATATNVLAKMSVTEDDLRDHYDATVDRYTSTDTNGVETVKKFEEVKDKVEKEVRRIAAVQFFETNLNFRAYAVKAAKGASRLDEIAKEDGLQVETSDWFSNDGGYQEGFMKRASQICPGAQGFAEAVAELDPESEDLRYAVVSSDRTVWLIEKAETSAKHTPTFDEAKDVIRPRALRDARADAFKAHVEEIAKKGAAAVAETKSVSTNITFTVSDLRQGGSSFEDAMSVARAAMKLKKGEVSEFTQTGPGKAILVICEDRVPGDAAKAMVLRSQVRDDLASLQLRQIPESWRKWNLERMGFEPGEVSSVENPAEDEAE
ncbi:MAG: SurA N-terminal domain-containing protein [Kiritimatiellae bacterium]|nr:SurA N-terminal domain-containing protein [Kiritimatiellia bacterium]